MFSSNLNLNNNTTLEITPSVQLVCLFYLYFILLIFLKQYKREFEAYAHGYLLKTHNYWTTLRVEVFFLI